MSLNDTNTAADDQALMRRFVAAAARAGIDTPEAWVSANRYRLVTADVAEGQDVADIRAYAQNVRDQALAAVPPPAGENTAAVTDTHITAAVDAVRGAEQ